MADDLYSNGYIMNYSDGTQSLERELPTILSSVPGITYVIKEGDNLPLLAFTHYDDSSLWYIIAEYNQIYNPFEDLEIGQEIFIPHGRRN